MSYKTHIHRNSWRRVWGAKPPGKSGRFGGPPGSPTKKKWWGRLGKGDFFASGKKWSGGKVRRIFYLTIPRDGSSLEEQKLKNFLTASPGSFKTECTHIGSSRCLLASRKPLLSTASELCSSCTAVVRLGVQVYKATLQAPQATEGGIFEARLEFYSLRKRLGWFSFNFKVFGQFWWFWWSGRDFWIWNGVKIIPKYCVDVDFWTFWDAIICATTVLLVNDRFKTDYSKRLRQPYVDLCHKVHLKHQNFISKFPKFREKEYVGFQMILLFVYRTQFWQ